MLSRRLGLWLWLHITAAFAGLGFGEPFIKGFLASTFVTSWQLAIVFRLNRKKLRAVFALVSLNTAMVAPTTEDEFLLQPCKRRSSGGIP